MKNPCAVMLISESRDYYQYLLHIEDEHDCIEQLKEENNELTEESICDYHVETNDENLNKKINCLMKKFVI